MEDVWREKKMRNEGGVRLNRQKCKVSMTSLILLRRTCEAIAVVEVHFLYALGEHEFVDGTCEKDDKERECAIGGNAVSRHSLQRFQTLPAVLRFRCD
jgi:hypothetical protein